jgi:acyl-CoA thioesterase I
MNISVKSVVYSILLFATLGALVYFWIRNSEVTNSKSTEVNTQVVAPSNDIYTIIAFGDSLTAGYGVTLEESYPSILENRLKEKFPTRTIKVINMGVSGDTTTGGLERVPFVVSQKPDLVLLALGANDMLRATPPSVTKNNLEKMITQLTSTSTSIILIGMKASQATGGIYKNAFDSIYPELSKKYSLPLVPFLLEGVVLRPTLNIEDGIHPNKKGYEKIVDENVLPVLVPYLRQKYHQ